MNAGSTMLSRGVSLVHGWLAPPVFSDEDKTRSVALLNQLILTGVGLWLAVFVLSNMVGMDNSLYNLINFVLCIIFLTIREIAKRGWVSFSILLFCCLLFVGLSVNIYQNGTLHSMRTAGLILGVIIPTLLMGSGAGLVFVILSSAFVFGLLHAELVGNLPSLTTSRLDSTNQWIVFTAITVFHRALVDAARKSMMEALARTRRALLERQQLEETLNWSKQRFRKTLDNIIEGCQIIDSAWRYIYVNEAVARHGKYRVEELLNHTMMEMYPGIEETEVFLVLQHCMKNRVTQKMENEFKFPDGSLGWFDLWIQPVPDGLMILFNDITERKLAEMALLESEERFRLLAENAQDLIYHYEIAPVRKFRYVSPVATKMTGYSPEEHYSDSDLGFKMVHPDDQHLLLEAARGELPQDGRLMLRWIRKDGSMLWKEQQNTPIFDSSGQMIAIEGIARDITERKHVEEALIASEKSYANLLKNISGAAYRCRNDTDWTVEYISGGCFALTGYRHDEIIENRVISLGALMHPEDADPIWEKCQINLAAQQTCSNEYRIFHRNGEMRWVWDQAQGVYSETGELIFIEGLFTDITERKQMEIERVRLQENLHRRNERLALMHQSTVNLLRQTSVDDLTLIITEEAAQLLRADVGYLALVDGEMLVNRGLTPEKSPYQMESVKLAEDKSILQQVIETRETFITEQFSFLPNLQPQIAAIGIKAGMVLPLLTSNACLGILGVGRIQTSVPFNKEDLYLGDLFAQLASLTLDNTQLRETLRQEAIHDPLTGLFNRRFMQETLRRELHRAKRNALSLAVVMLDLDNFKIINNTFGHDMGDEMLRELGALLQTKFRGNDVACRYGGDEFTLILPEASLDNILVRMEEFRRNIKLLTNYHQLQKINELTISIGVAMFPEHGSNEETLLKTADQALYHAKQKGRDRVIAA